MDKKELIEYLEDYELAISHLQLVGCVHSIKAIEDHIYLIKKLLEKNEER